MLLVHLPLCLYLSLCLSLSLSLSRGLRARPRWGRLLVEGTHGFSRSITPERRPNKQGERRTMFRQADSVIERTDRGDKQRD